MGTDQNNAIQINASETERLDKSFLRVSSTRLESLAIILFFSQAFNRWLFNIITPDWGGYIALLLPYLVLLFLLSVRCGKGMPLDFIVLFVGIIVFFLITYFWHPEYEEWYTKEYYGVWDYVLRPDNGIYAYLFLRLSNDPKEILRCLKVSSLCIYAYSFVAFVRASRMGYWLTEWNGDLIKTSYSLEFGYDLLLYVLVFLYYALKYRRIGDFLLAALGVFMIVGAGSRGPVLDIMIFIALYVVVELDNTKHKGIALLALSVLAIAIMVFYIPILTYLASVLDSLGLHSRFIRLFLEGNISDDNGRMIIWQRAVEMIRDNPFGYGAMGSRHVISNIIYVGHPHNIFLEILIDFGVLVGAGLIIGGTIAVIYMLKTRISDEWKGLIMILLGTSSQLLLSGTYWHRPGVWALLAIGVGVHVAKKREQNKHVG